MNWEAFQLRDKKVLITGAAGTIGSRVAVAFAEAGAQLILTDINEKSLDSVAKKVGETNVCKIIPCDLTSDNDVDLLINTVVGLGELHVLINNAAFVGTSKLQGWATTFENQTWETFRDVVDLNLGVPFRLSKAFAPILTESGGAIVNVTSIYGLVGPDYSLYEGTDMANPAAYAASKGGLVQLTRWLSTTLAPEVRVNSIAPGGLRGNQPASFIERYEKRTPLGRMAVDDDLVGPVLFFASPLSEYVTGQVLPVDGGWTAW